jgi:hypothetical protein
VSPTSVEPEAKTPAAAESADVQAPQGWAPKLVGQAKTAARDAALNEASKERELVSVGGSTTTSGGVGLSYSAKLTEKVALKTSDPLVAGDTRRKAAADTGDVVWTKLSASGTTGASLGKTVSPSVSASFGFSAGAEVTAIVAADKSLSLKNLGGTVKDQGETLALAMDPDRLLADKHAPGTELMIRGQASSSASLGAGAGLTGIGIASVGVSVSASHSDQFTKNVKVLEDGKVYAQVAKLNSSAQGISAGLNAGVDLPAATLGGAAGSKALDMVAGKIEEKVRLTASVGASSGQTDSLKLGGVFDLKTQGGRDAFAYLMKTNPLELQANPKQAETTLRNMGMGVAYSEATRTGGVSANIQVGTTNLLNFASSSRTTEGVLLEKKDAAGSVIEQSKLSEQEYSRNVGGLLPRLMVGEERTLSIRAGSVSKDGVETKAALASLSIKDPKVTEGEQKELAAFASQMGMTLPPAGKAGGKGTFAVQVALTDANLQQLQQRSAEDIRTAFTFSKGSIEGSPAPWTNNTPAAVNPHYRYAPQKLVKEEFRDGAQAWNSQATFGDPNGEKSTIVRDYKATTGRDLQSDVESQDAMNRIAEELVKVRGKPVTEWGPALSAIGSQNSRDVRTALVALNRLAGASLVSLSVDANGVAMNASPSAAPKSAADLVGPLLTPAFVN